MTAVEAFNELAARELDLWLEQRRLYRELVAAGAHRGVPVPVRPPVRTRPTRRATGPRILYRDIGQILQNR